jgi:hypothetical protein
MSAELQYVIDGEPTDAAALDRALAEMLLDVPVDPLRVLVTRHYDALSRRVFRPVERLSWRTMKGQMVRIWGELAGWRDG